MDVPATATRATRANKKARLTTGLPSLVLPPVVSRLRQTAQRSAEASDALQANAAAALRDIETAFDAVRAAVDARQAVLTAEVHVAQASKQHALDTLAAQVDTLLQPWDDVVAAAAGRVTEKEAEEAAPDSDADALVLVLSPRDAAWTLASEAAEAAALAAHVPACEPPTLTLRNWCPGAWLQTVNRWGGVFAPRALDTRGLRLMLHFEQPKGSTPVTEKELRLVAPGARVYVEAVWLLAAGPSPDTAELRDFVSGLQCTLASRTGTVTLRPPQTQPDPDLCGFPSGCVRRDLGVIVVPEVAEVVYTWVEFNLHTADGEPCKLFDIDNNKDVVQFRVFTVSAAVQRSMHTERGMELVTSLLQLAVSHECPVLASALCDWVEGPLGRKTLAETLAVSWQHGTVNAFVRAHVAVGVRLKQFAKRVLAFNAELADLRKANTRGVLAHDTDDDVGGLAHDDAEELLCAANATAAVNGAAGTIGPSDDAFVVPIYRTLVHQFGAFRDASNRFAAETEAEGYNDDDFDDDDVEGLWEASLPWQVRAVECVLSSGEDAWPGTELLSDLRNTRTSATCVPSTLGVDGTRLRGAVLRCAGSPGRRPRFLLAAVEHVWGTRCCDAATDAAWQDLLWQLLDETTAAAAAAAAAAAPPNDDGNANACVQLVRGGLSLSAGDAGGLEAQARTDAARVDAFLECVFLAQQPCVALAVLDNWLLKDHGRQECVRRVGVVLAAARGVPLVTSLARLYATNKSSTRSLAVSVECPRVLAQLVAHAPVPADVAKVVLHALPAAELVRCCGSVAKTKRDSEPAQQWMCLVHTLHHSSPAAAAQLLQVPTLQNTLWDVLAAVMHGADSEADTAKRTCVELLGLFVTAAPPPGVRMNTRAVRVNTHGWC